MLKMSRAARLENYVQTTVISTLHTREGSLMVFNRFFLENQCVERFSSLKADRRVNRFQFPFAMLTASAKKSQLRPISLSMPPNGEHAG